MTAIARRRAILLLFACAASAPLLTREAARAEAATSACGNGLLENDESCESCPADCKADECEPATGSATFDVDLASPSGKQPTAATLRLAYRSKVLSLPGSGGDASVRQRVRSDANPAVLIANDLGYAVRVVIAKGGELGAKSLFRISFDHCSGAAAPRAAHLACAVEGCSGGAGAIAGCSCAAHPAPAP